MKSKTPKRILATFCYEMASSAYSCYIVFIYGDDFIIILEQNAIRFLFKLNFDFIFIANIVRFKTTLFDLFLVFCVFFGVLMLVKIENYITISSRYNSTMENITVYGDIFHDISFIDRLYTEVKSYFFKFSFC